MSVKPDRWIRRMALEHKMIEPFTDRQVREGVIKLRRVLVWIRHPGGRRIPDLHEREFDHRGPETFRSQIVGVLQRGFLFDSAELVCAGALGGIFPHSAECVDDLAWGNPRTRAAESL